MLSLLEVTWHFSLFVLTYPLQILLALSGTLLVSKAFIHLLLFPFFFFLNFTRRIIALQYCVGFCHTSTWISHRYTYAPPLDSLLSPIPSYPPMLSHSTCFDLHHAANFHWLPILHMVIYMFPRYSLSLSYPLLPLLCP